MVALCVVLAVVSSLCAGISATLRRVHVLTAAAIYAAGLSTGAVVMLVASHG